MSDHISGEQRYTRDRACPVCGGHATDPRGQGVRCYGFVSGAWAHCSREEKAGTLKMSPGSDTFGHHLGGGCGCPAGRHDIPAWWKKKVTEYEVKDITGKVQAVHVRIDFPDGEKTFLWKQADGTLGLTRPETSLPFYGSEILKGLPAGQLTILNEGEKARDALTKAGFPAVSTVTGAHTTHDSDVFRTLLGHPVAVWPDNDLKGLRHLGLNVHRLRDVNHPDARKVIWADAPEKGDAHDFFRLGHTADELRAMLAAAPPVSADDGWPEPEPVPTALRPVPPFDYAMLPEPFVPWVKDIAERMQCAPDVVAVAAMVAAGSVIGRQLTVRPKQQDDWTEVPNLWGLVVLPPGTMKSTAIKEGFKPINRLVATAMAAWVEKQQAARLEAYKAKVQIKALEKEIEAKVKKKLDVTKLWADLEALKNRAEPKPRRYIVNDATVEKVGELLIESPTGLLLYRDEMNGLFQTMDREQHQNDRAFYNEAWNGSNSYAVDRITRGSLWIPALCLALFGGIQPGPLRMYLAETFGDGHKADGFIQRFGMMVFPDTDPAWTRVDRYPDSAAQSPVYEIFERLSAINPKALRAEETTPPCLRFSATAQKTFNEWWSALERRIRRQDDDEVLTGHIATHKKLVPALALIIHVVEVSGTKVKLGYAGISERAVGKAIAWAVYLEQHARRVYATVTDQGTVAVAELARKIQSGAVPSRFRARTAIIQKGWSGLRDEAIVDVALQRLEEMGWVRSERIQNEQGGRPTIEYIMNPRVKAAKP